MKTLIVYATNSGGTQAASEIIAETLRKAGQTVELRRASESSAAELLGYDLVVLGSCTWERLEDDIMLDGQLQQHMYALTQKLKGQTWASQRFAVFGLGDSSYTHFCRAAEFLEIFVREAKGVLIVPSLKIDGFFFDLDKNRGLVSAWAKTLAKNKE